MSYALDLPVDIRRIFLTLPIELQEAVLDELERIARSPPDPRLTEGHGPSEAVRDLAGVRHYAFFMYLRDVRTRMIVVESMGHVINMI